MAQGTGHRAQGAGRRAHKEQSDAVPQSGRAQSTGFASRNFSEGLAWSLR